MEPKKNCGCGKDPCITYGAELVTPKFKGHDKCLECGNIEVPVSEMDGGEIGLTDYYFSCADCDFSWYVSVKTDEHEDGERAYVSNEVGFIDEDGNIHQEPQEFNIMGQPNLVYEKYQEWDSLMDAESFGAESLPQTLEDCKKRLGIAEEVLSMSDAVQTYNKYLLQEMGIDRYADDELDSESFGANDDISLMMSIIDEIEANDIWNETINEMIRRGKAVRRPDGKVIFSDRVPQFDVIEDIAQYTTPEIKSAENSDFWMTFGRVDYNWITDPEDLELTDENFSIIDAHIRDEVRYVIDNDADNSSGESNLSSGDLNLTQEDEDEFTIYYYWGSPFTTGVNSAESFEAEDLEYPCQICGKPSDYNFQDGTLRWKIKDDEFVVGKPKISVNGDQNDFYCKEHADLNETGIFYAEYTPEQRIDDYTPEQLTTSSAITGDFFEDSLKYSYGGTRAAENIESPSTQGSKRNTSLKGADLSGYDLTNANLHGANLTGVNLTDADVRFADLSGVNLKYSNLENANLSNAKLIYANLRYANLRNADLGNAYLYDADMRNANLTGVKKAEDLSSFTSKELTESSAIHGDFDHASINYSGHQNLEVLDAEENIALADPSFWMNYPITSMLATAGIFAIGKTLLNSRKGDI